MDAITQDLEIWFICMLYYLQIFSTLFTANQTSPHTFPMGEALEM